MYAIRSYYVAENEIRPHAASLDREGRFPTEIIEKMGPLNYFGLQVPPSLGGAGLDTISYAIVIEELSRVCAALGLCVSVHNSVGLYPILRFGTDEQIARFVPDMAKGLQIGAFCLTEANAGSDKADRQIFLVSKIHHRHIPCTLIHHLFKGSYNFV